MKFVSSQEIGIVQRWHECCCLAVAPATILIIIKYQQQTCVRPTSVDSIVHFIRSRNFASVRLCAKCKMHHAQLCPEWKCYRWRIAPKAYFACCFLSIDEMATIAGAQRKTQRETSEREGDERERGRLGDRKCIFRIFRQTLMHMVVAS